MGKRQQISIEGLSGWRGLAVAVVAQTVKDAATTANTPAAAKLRREAAAYIGSDGWAWWLDILGLSGDLTPNMGSGAAAGD